MEQINWTLVIQTGITLICALLGSAGIWTFLDHRQQRKADKEMHDDEVLKEVREMRTENAKFREDLMKELESIKETVDENEAKASRIRILKFADEVFMEMNHSKDSFDQCMSDITFYEKYCSDHPKFKNHQTAETAKYIDEVYRERMKKKDFARYGMYREGS